MQQKKEVLENLEIPEIRDCVLYNLKILSFPALHFLLHLQAVFYERIRCCVLTHLTVEGSLCYTDFTGVAFLEVSFKFCCTELMEP